MIAATPGAERQHSRGGALSSAGMVASAGHPPSVGLESWSERSRGIGQTTSPSDQKEPSADPNTMTATSAAAAPTMPTITMSR